MLIGDRGKHEQGILHMLALAKQREIYGSKTFNNVCQNGKQ